MQRCFHGVFECFDFTSIHRNLRRGPDIQLITATKRTFEDLKKQIALSKQSSILRM